MHALTRKRLDQIETMEEPLVTKREQRRMAREVKQLREEFLGNKLAGYREGVLDALLFIEDPALRERIEYELIDQSSARTA